MSLFLHSELSSAVHEIGVLLLPGPRDSAALFFFPPLCSSAVVAHRGLCPAVSGASPSRRREAPGGVMQEVRNATSSAPAASPTTGRRVPASFATARRPLGRRHAQVSCVREYLIPRVAARDLRPTSIREDDSYNVASTGDLASDHGPLPSPREATTRLSPGETRRIFAKTTTHRRRRRPRCTCSGHGNVQQRRQLSSF